MEGGLSGRRKRIRGRERGQKRAMGAMHYYEQLYMLLNMKTQRKYLRGSQLQTFILCGDFRLEMLAFFTSCLRACCWFTVFFSTFSP